MLCILLFLCNNPRQQVVKHSLAPLNVQETKDVETCVAGVRSDKVKTETAAKAAAAKSTVVATTVGSDARLHAHRCQEEADQRGQVWWECRAG